jgi:hypothetical protein
MLPLIMSIILTDPLEQFDITYLFTNQVNSISTTLVLHLLVLSFIFFIRKEKTKL